MASAAAALPAPRVILVRRTVGRGRVQGGQGMDAGSGDVGDGAGFDIGGPQRGAVGSGEELDGAAERLVLLAEPQVVAVLADAGDAIGGDQGARGTVHVPYRGRWEKLSAMSAGGQPITREDPRSGQAGDDDMGVGGNDGWGAHTLDAYKLFPDHDYAYTYRLRPLTDVGQAMELSRQPVEG